MDRPIPLRVRHGTTRPAGAAGNVTCKPVEIEGRTVAKITVKKGDEPAYMGPPCKPAVVVREGRISVTFNTPDALNYICKRFPCWSGGRRRGAT